MTEKRVVEVYRAENGCQAHQFAIALEEAGIKAEIQGASYHPASLNADNLFTISAMWWDAPRILVSAQDAERASELLFELEARERKKAEEVEASPPIVVVCEECGSRTLFPAALRGSVQECPKCWAFLDVGDD